MANASFKIQEKSAPLLAKRSQDESKSILKQGGSKYTSQGLVDNDYFIKYNQKNPKNMKLSTIDSYLNRIENFEEVS